MEEFAKITYDFETGETFDRTLRPHKYPLDIDIYAPKAGNPEARRWLYVASARTLEKAKKDVQRIVKDVSSRPLKVRIIEAKTGRIIEEHEEP
jgi:hypothetical protein